MTSKNKAALLGMFLTAAIFNAHAGVVGTATGAVSSAAGSVVGAGSNALSSLWNNKVALLTAAGVVGGTYFAGRNLIDLWNANKDMVEPTDILNKIANGHPLTEDENALYQVYLLQQIAMSDLRTKMYFSAFVAAASSACGGCTVLKDIGNGAWDYVPNMPYFGAAAKEAAKAAALAAAPVAPAAPATAG